MRWKRIIILAALVLTVGLAFQLCMDHNQQKATYEQSLGTWQNAYENGTIVKETHKKESSGDHIITASYRLYDVTGDGAPDFEIVMRWGKPDTWKYVREDGSTYG